ncbi:MAG TPA: 50S ribosomal protein L13 [Elusimicrobia bacterium]|jgi:large subunit ribosomal protein L13|nr:50S ribosomal protein L13 [Elusimicrobiota bacterium]
MNTYFPKPEEIEKKWYLIDVENKVLGRLATRIAILLQGKQKPYFTPNLDCGDYVVVINAKKIKVTGKKLKEKTYLFHSGHPQGAKYITCGELLERHPEKVLSLAVKRMLPKNKLGDKLLKKLKIYPGKVYREVTQKPIELKI